MEMYQSGLCSWKTEIRWRSSLCFRSGVLKQEMVQELEEPEESAQEQA